MRSAYNLYRGLASALLVGMGVLQAWDSGAFSSPLHVLLQILAAVMLPPGAVLLSKRGGVWAAAVVVSALLLLLARLTAPRPLPALLVLVGFQAAVLYFLYRKLWPGRGTEPELQLSTGEVQP